MILSGKQIEKNLGTNIIVDPFNEKNINPNSYNVSLAPDLLVYTEPVLDMKSPNSTKELTIPESGLELHPNKLYLGRTAEYTETRNFVPMLEGRSSIGRLICLFTLQQALVILASVVTGPWKSLSFSRLECIQV